MKTIPEEVTIPLQELLRSALRSLLDSGPAGMDLDELLQGVLITGLAQLLKGRPLAGIADGLEEKAQAFHAMGEKSLEASPRVAADFLGFSIDDGQQAALDDLLATYAHLTEEEVCRILLDCGLKNLHDDPFVQELLASTRPGSVPAEGEQA